MRNENVDNTRENKDVIKWAVDERWCLDRLKMEREPGDEVMLM